MIALCITNKKFLEYPHISKLTSASTALIIYEDWDEDAETEYVLIPNFPIGSGFYSLEAYGLSKEEAILQAISAGFSEDTICEFFNLSEEEFKKYFFKCLKETDPDEWDFGKVIFKLPYISWLIDNDTAKGIFKVDEDTFIIATWEISIGGPYNFSFKRVDKEEALKIALDHFNEEDIKELFK